MAYVPSWSQLSFIKFLQEINRKHLPDSVQSSRSIRSRSFLGFQTSFRSRSSPSKRRWCLQSMSSLKMEESKRLQYITIILFNRGAQMVFFDVFQVGRTRAWPCGFNNENERILCRQCFALRLWPRPFCMWISSGRTSPASPALVQNTLPMRQINEQMSFGGC